jgi:hypothetical protein
MGASDINGQNILRSSMSQGGQNILRSSMSQGGQNILRSSMSQGGQIYWDHLCLREDKIY